MYRQEDQDSKWFCDFGDGDKHQKAKIGRRRAAATEELRCYGQLIHFVFILVGFPPCSHWFLFLLQTGQTSRVNSGMERGYNSICDDHIN
jgi:hypothetical protein